MKSLMILGVMETMYIQFTNTMTNIGKHPIVFLVMANINGIRDNDFEISKVYPHTVVTKTKTYLSHPQVKGSRYHHKVFEVEAKQFPGLPENVFDSSQTEALEKFMDWMDLNKGELTL